MSEEAPLAQALQVSLPELEVSTEHAGLNGVDASATLEDPSPSAANASHPVHELALSCAQCALAAHADDSLSYGGLTWHHKCFKCSECSVVVNLRGVAMIGSKLYCKDCFKRAFHEHGSYTAISSPKDTSQPTPHTAPLHLNGDTVPSPSSSSASASSVLRPHASLMRTSSFSAIVSPDAQCKECGNTVAQSESVVYYGDVWHKKCFKCSLCSKLVTMQGVAMIRNKRYCKSCFKKSFRSRGSYSDLSLTADEDTAPVEEEPVHVFVSIENDVTPAQFHAHSIELPPAVTEADVEAAPEPEDAATIEQQLQQQEEQPPNEKQKSVAVIQTQEGPIFVDNFEDKLKKLSKARHKAKLLKKLKEDRAKYHSRLDEEIAAERSLDAAEIPKTSETHWAAKLQHHDSLRQLMAKRPSVELQSRPGLAIPAAVSESTGIQSPVDEDEDEDDDEEEEEEEKEEEKDTGDDTAETPQDQPAQAENEHVVTVDSVPAAGAVSTPRSPQASEPLVENGLMADASVVLPSTPLDGSVIVPPPTLQSNDDSGDGDGDLSALQQQQRIDEVEQQLRETGLQAESLLQQMKSAEFDHAPRSAPPEASLAAQLAEEEEDQPRSDAAEATPFQEPVSTAASRASTTYNGIGGTGDVASVDESQHTDQPPSTLVTPPPTNAPTSEVSILPSSSFPAHGDDEATAPVLTAAALLAAEAEAEEEEVAENDDVATELPRALSASSFGAASISLVVPPPSSASDGSAGALSGGGGSSGGFGLGGSSSSVELGAREHRLHTLDDRDETRSVSASDVGSFYAALGFGSSAPGQQFSRFTSSELLDPLDSSRQLAVRQYSDSSISGTQAGQLAEYVLLSEASRLQSGPGVLTLADELANAQEEESQRPQSQLSFAAEQPAEKRESVMGGAEFDPAAFQIDLHTGEESRTIAGSNGTAYGTGGAHVATTSPKRSSLSAVGRESSVGPSGMRIALPGQQRSTDSPEPTANEPIALPTRMSSDEIAQVKGSYASFLVLRQKQSQLGAGSSQPNTHRSIGSGSEYVPDDDRSAADEADVGTGELQVNLELAKANSLEQEGGGASARKDSDPERIKLENMHEQQRQKTESLLRQISVVTGPATPTRSLSRVDFTLPSLPNSAAPTPRNRSLSNLDGKKEPSSKLTLDSRSRAASSNAALPPGSFKSLLEESQRVFSDADASALAAAAASSSAVAAKSGSMAQLPAGVNGKPATGEGENGTAPSTNGTNSTNPEPNALKNEVGSSDGTASKLNTESRACRDERGNCKACAVM